MYDNSGYTFLMISGTDVAKHLAERFGIANIHTRRRYALTLECIDKDEPQ